MVMSPMRPAWDMPCTDLKWAMSTEFSASSCQTERTRLLNRRHSTASSATTWGIVPLGLDVGVRVVPEQQVPVAHDRGVRAHPCLAVGPVGVGDVDVGAVGGEGPLVERADEAAVLDPAADGEVGAEVGAVGVEHVDGVAVAPDHEVLAHGRGAADRLVAQVVEAAEREPAEGERERKGAAGIRAWSVGLLVTDAADDGAAAHRLHIVYNAAEAATVRPSRPRRLRWAGHRWAMILAMTVLGEHGTDLVGSMADIVTAEAGPSEAARS